MKRKVTFFALCLVVAAVMLFACCSKREAVAATPTPTAEATAVPTAEPSPTPAPTATPTPTATAAPTSAYTNPLTGEPTETDTSSLRPIACMLNNHEGSLPQCGISSADIIYEICEEGITRMIGIFDQMPDCDRLGSIRSTRPYHADIALSYDAIFVHWGRSDAAATFLWNSGIDDIELNQNPAGEYSYRDYTHGTGATEHTGFIKIDKLQQFITDKGWRTTHDGFHGYGFVFADDVQPAGGDAAKVTVSFASKRSNFTYDASQGGYTMAEYGVDYKDGDTGKIPVFANVLVLRTTIYNETGIASMVLTDTNDTGYLFCNGKYEEITWSRGDYGDNFQYFDASGNPLEFAVGKTYICIVAHDDTVNF